MAKKAPVNAGISPKDMKARIKAGNIPSLCLITGEEDYLKKDLVSYMRKNIVKSEMPEMNIRMLDAARCSVDDIVADAQTIPFMAERTLTVVRDFSPYNFDAREITPLTELVKNPPEFGTLVFWHQVISLTEGSRSAKGSDDEGDAEGSEEAGGKAEDKGSAKIYRDFLNALKKNAVTVECAKASYGELRTILKKGIEKRGCQISSYSLDFLLDFVGNDLTLLLNEVEKLCIFKGSGEITPSDIEKVCTRSIESKVFDISKNILSGRTEEALMILHDLFLLKEVPEKISGALNTNFIDMYRVKIASEAGKTNKEIAEAFGIKSDFRINRAKDNSAKFSKETLRRFLDVLAETDMELKGDREADTEEKKEIILQKAIIRLAPAKG